MFTSILITILFILILICLGYILYLKYSKKYTRERFAFFGVTTIAALLTSFFAQIYSSQGFVSAVINTINSVFHKNVQHYNTDFKDHILTLILLIFFMQFISRFHKNWNGPISETLYNKRKFHENPTILTEGYLQLKDFFSKEKSIQTHIDEEKISRFNIFTPKEDDKTPWYESVYELFTFSSVQYKIDLQNDYYQEESVFISKFGQNNLPIAILCSLDTPENNKLQRFVLFCKDQKLEIYKIYCCNKKRVK